MRKMFILLMMLLFVSGAALGQGLPPAFCGDLSEADCAILEQSTEAMRELESAAFNFDLNFALENVPDEAFDSLTFRITGDGAYATDPDLMNNLITNPAALLENPEQLPETLTTVIESIAADANILIFFPPELTDIAASEGTPLPSRVGLSVRLVDGVGYINLDKMAALDTAGDLPRGWVGLDISAALEKVFEEIDLSELGNIPGYDPEAMNAFYDPALLGKFVSVTRGADGESDGQNAASFEYVMNLGALYADPDYRDMMREQLMSTYESMDLQDSISDSDIDSLLDMMAQMYDGFVITMQQTIGLDDYYVHAMSFALDWSINLDTFSMEFDSAASDAPTLEFSLNFQGNLSQFNDAPAITAPEDAELVPLDDLFGPSMGGSFS